MTICGLSLHHWNTETRKNLEQKFIFELGTLYPHGISERLSFHQFIHKFMSLYLHQWQSSSTLPYKPGRRENFFSLPKPGGKYNLSSKFVKSKGEKAVEIIKNTPLIDSENCLFIKANQVSTKERTRRPGGQGMETIALNIAVTASALFLALLFVGTFIDILTNAAMKLGVPYRAHTIINLELQQVPLLKEVSKEKQHWPKKVHWRILYVLARRLNHYLMRKKESWLYI